ncbi:MAG: YbaB/EbfC family nucleoid-associated protein [Eggerthellaceae bacterium]|nr:YbaB/EbfC family nucleoid-associated protein [Eggerthellaceae bacterium]
MDMNQLMQQAQKMQADLARAQEEVKQLTYTASSGGGVVTAVATGDGRLESLEIDPEAVDPDDVEMLQDMVLAAVNEALRGVAEAGEQRMSSATGFDLPDLSGLSGLL